MASNAPLWVEAPPRNPTRFGLLSAALVIDEPDGHWEMGTQYVGDQCLRAYVTGGACEEPAGLIITPDPDNNLAIDVYASGVPAGSEGTLVIDWGDGTQEPMASNPASHTYATSGSFRVAVGGDGYRQEPDHWGIPLRTAVDTTKKVAYSGIPKVGSHQFTLYSLVDCKPVGWADGQYGQRQLTQGEGLAAELEFEVLFLGRDKTADVTPTAGAAVDPVTGLALLEQWAAQYVPQPVVHAPRGVASILAAEQAIVRRDVDHLETNLGAPVAAGAYTGVYGPSGQIAPEGTAWLYVTGPVTIRRGPVQVHHTFDPGSNVAHQLAERPYSVSVECHTAGVLVALNGCCVVPDSPEPVPTETLSFDWELTVYWYSGDEGDPDWATVEFLQTGGIMSAGDYSTDLVGVTADGAAPATKHEDVTLDVDRVVSDGSTRSWILQDVVYGTDFTIDITGPYGIAVRIDATATSSLEVNTVPDTIDSGTVTYTRPLPARRLDP